jgi:hypothetical protein
MSNELTTETMSNELTTETAIDFLEQFTRETSRKMWAGELLKYVKGEYQVGKEEMEVEIGTKMVAIVPTMINGWIKWEDRHPVAHNMGVVVEGFRLPKREDLGDPEEDGEWGKDDNGVARDPWQRNALMVMIDEDDNIYTFSTGSKGGLSALGELVRAYCQHARMLPTQVPVIELQTSSYKHANTSYGKVHTPVFKVIGWEEQAKFMALLNGAGEKEDEPKAKRVSATPKATPPAAKGKNAGKNHRIRFA